MERDMVAPIFEMIAQERDRQDKKWGYPQRNTLPEWGIILSEEVGEAMKELNELHFRGNNLSLEYTALIDELIHVAAVSVSIIEHLIYFGLVYPEKSKEKGDV